MDKTVFISGATDGIGRETAKLLAEKGYRMLVHGRNGTKLHTLLDELNDVNPSVPHASYMADFTCISDVQAMLEDIQKQEDRIDVLISNAGVYVTEKNLVSSEQIEETFMVNQVAAFILINGIIPVMEKQGGGQILQVASMIHAQSLDFDQVMNPSHYNASRAYGESKLCNIMMVKKLAPELKPKGILINSLHPGVINTKILRKGWGAMGDSPLHAAQHIYKCLQVQDVSNTGAYLVDAQPAKAAKFADDPANQQTCWELNKKLL
jgi:NAD(P)-dependent dehydrogenase (short-subunit alcohol dehydrogenase family)